MAKRITINTIAERAGVSRGTVDRVLNGRPHVKPEIAERVLRTMRELGYAPPRAEQADALGLSRSASELPSGCAVDERKRLSASGAAARRAGRTGLSARFQCGISGAEM